jgi:hypothetical protein
MKGKQIKLSIIIFAYMSKMDADIQQQIRHEVVNAVAQSQNALMSQLKDLISTEMGKLPDQLQKLVDLQITHTFSRFYYRTAGKFILPFQRPCEHLPFLGDFRRSFILRFSH